MEFSQERFNTMLTDQTVSEKDCTVYLDECKLDADIVKIYKKKAKEAKKDMPKQELTTEEKQQLAIEKFGWYDKRIMYSVNEKGKTGQYNIAILNNLVNNKVLVELVSPGICRSIIHNAEFLGDRAQRIEPRHEIQIQEECIRKTNGGKLERKDISEAISSLGYANEFNPIANWLDTLVPKEEYKGITHRWLQEVFGAEDMDVISKIGWRWILQAVARGRTPGRYNESVLVLMAENGSEGKSRFVMNLGPNPTYSYEGSPDLDSTQSSAQTLIGSWFVDFSEGDTHDKHSVETNKRFITTGFDKYVEKYQNRNITVARPYVFIMTTNNDVPLLNNEINWIRRWNVVKINEFNIKRWLEIKETLFAEANKLLLELDAVRQPADKDPYVLQDEDKAELVEYSTQFVKASSLRHKLTEHFRVTNNEEYYTSDQILDLCRKWEPRCSPQSIRSIMVELGFVKVRKLIDFGDGKKQRWVYEKKIASPSASVNNMNMDEIFQKVKESSHVQ